jgi:hypothetical protein
MKARLGIAPAARWNVDLAELSAGVGLEERLRQAKLLRVMDAAGYSVEA